MGGAADYGHRSSSPLKRRADSMEADGVVADSQDTVMDNNDRDQDSGFAGSADGSADSKHDDHDVDKVMADGDRHEMGKITADMTIPPLTEQIKTIQTLLAAFGQSGLQEGDSTYLVSRSWLDHALELGSAKNVKDQSQPTLGPVDNSDLIQNTVHRLNGDSTMQLRPGLGMESFEYFPKDAWDLLVSWCGLVKGQLPIVRYAVNTNPDALMPNLQFEVYPPVFTVHRLWSSISPIALEQELKSIRPPPFVVMCSSMTPFNSFLRAAKNAAKIPTDSKVRTWRVISKPAATAKTPPLMSTPPDSPEAEGTDDPWSSVLLDLLAFTALNAPEDRELVQDAKDNTNNSNYNGKSMTLGLLGLATDQAIVLDEKIDGDHYVSNFNPAMAGKNKGFATRSSSTSLTATNRGTNSGRVSPAPSGPVTRGRSQKAGGKAQGTVGLGNLGNTCYMNSALQCIRSVEELTKYFLVNEDEKELNTDNPLGHNGDVAKAYSKLLHDIYKLPTPSPIHPKHFKNVVGRYAPAFSGYGQQDSQEFLGFLLDGLQEDLSRIKKKPYIEKPDSTDDMIGNQAAIAKMAAQVWDITKKRDDSVVADLFTGMYKSTLVCPVCHKVSITFDPFNNLTLPLPIQSLWTKKVKYVPLNDPPVFISVEMDKSSSIKGLKDFISARVGVPSERLVGAEEFREKFYKIYEDFNSVADEIGANDFPVMYEVEAVPTNTNAPRKAAKKKLMPGSFLNGSDDADSESNTWDDPMAERLLVPVIHRLKSDGTYTYKKQATEGCTPHFIVLTPTEARSEEVIRRKVLEKIATFTTYQFLESDGTQTPESDEHDFATTTTSDVDSAGESKVLAKSIEGEDDIVDVIMEGTANVGKSATAAKPFSLSSPLLRKFNGRRPNWLDPSEYIGMESLFELGYFSESGALIPTGWSAVSENQTYPPLKSRIIVNENDHASPSTADSGISSDNSSIDDSQELSANTFEGAPTRMNDEDSSEESDTFPRVEQLHMQPAPRLPYRAGSGRGSKKKFKPRQAYSKKGQRRMAREQRAATAAAARVHTTSSRVEIPASGPDSGPLVRLGEGVIVLWDASSFDTIFGKDPKETDDHMRGLPLYTNPPTLPDPKLEAKKQARESRRKHGITLDECLDEFEKDEILSEQDMWYCPRCKEHRRASKKFDLWKTPDILVVHLKRFSSSGYRRDKLDVNVDFPIEGLDLSTRVIDKQDGKQEIYDLIGVDDHWGGLGGGHYTAFAKNFTDGQWYEYNDSSVSKQTDLRRIISSAAYLLFYRRRSDKPLGGPRFAEINERYDSKFSSDDDNDASDPGEGQRLGINSSRNGLSSALTGAGVTLHDGRGSASGQHGQGPGAGGEGAVIVTATSPSQGDLPPAYSSLSDDGDEVTFVEDVNSVKYQQPKTLADATRTTWTFSNLNASAVAANSGSVAGAAGLDVDYASDDAQGPDSDAGSSTRGYGKMADSDDDELHTKSEVETPQFEDVLPLPPPMDVMDQIGLEDIREQAWEEKQLHRHHHHHQGIHTIGMDGGGFADVGDVHHLDDDAASDKAVVEIHIEDGDD